MFMCKYKYLSNRSHGIFFYQWSSLIITLQLDIFTLTLEYLAVCSHYMNYLIIMYLFLSGKFNDVTIIFRKKSILSYKLYKFSYFRKFIDFLAVAAFITVVIHVVFIIYSYYAVIYGDCVIYVQRLID